MRYLLSTIGLIGASATLAFGRPGADLAQVSVGLHTYDPALDAVRSRLQAAGGGRLIALDDGRDALYLSLQQLGGAATDRYRLARGLSAFRYRGRAQAGDYLLELERFSGTLLSVDVGDYGDLQPYWGGGLDLMRMKREGSVEVRGAPPATRKDWLWGLHLEAGCQYLVTEHLAVGSKATYLYSPDSAFDGIDYGLNDVALVYYATIVFRR